MVTRFHKPSRRAFSLVEVVVALAIVVFALFSMVGLLGVGLQNSQDSRERVQAATIAEQICSIRRAAPTTNFVFGSAPQPAFPLPTLLLASSGTNYVTRDGQLTTQDKADFGLVYTITPKFDTVPANTQNGVSQVYMGFFWPPRASPGSPSTGKYEVTTTFGLQ